MKARKFNWALNVLTLVAMALALVAAPMSPASANVNDVQNEGMHVEPANAQAYAHYIFWYQITRSLPKESTAYVKFPPEQYDPLGDGAGDGQNDDSKIPNLTYDTGAPELAKMLISWGPTQNDIVDPGGDWDLIPATATQSAPPLKSFAWRDPAVNWLEDGEVRMAVPIEDIPEGYYVRMDFWGPANINPGKMDAGIQNPDQNGNYCWKVATDEEGEWQDVCYDIKEPFPVRLFRKFQVPLENCGYTYPEYIRGFDKIQDALDAADAIWLNDGDYIDEPFWNLFQECPDLSTIDAGANADFFAAASKGVAVGAVIVVDPGTYTETLDMDTPGVILGSMEGPAVTIIEANHGVLPASPDDAVDIWAGGITLGKSEFDLGDNPPPATTFPPMLQGFTIRNADTGGNFDGVHVDPNDVHATGKEKCVGTDIYSNTVKGWGLLATDNYTVTQIGAFSDTLVFSDTADFSADFIANLRTGAKLVDLTTGWSGHISMTTCAAPILGLNDVCLQLKAGGPDDDLIEVNADRFAAGDAVAVFYVTANYDCPDARVDIRDNVIHNNSWDGINVFSASVWVDGNEVYNNTEDGFYGQDLKCCGSIAICDGINRTDKMLEISNNKFYDNGYVDTDEFWSDDGNCFAPDGKGDDSGIEIWSTVSCDEPEHLYIHDNETYGNVHAGIWLQNDSADCGIRILKNKIYDNGVFGVSNEAAEYGRTIAQGPDWAEPTKAREVDVIFKYNDVYGNGFWGVKNWAADYTSPAMFNAKENYWGMPGGPSEGPEACRHEPEQQSAALGNGDAVCKGTFYNPWLAAGYESIYYGGDYQGRRAYGSDSLQLQAGWNTLAIPLPVDNSFAQLKANTVTEQIFSLGDYLGDCTTWDNCLVEQAWQYNHADDTWEDLLAGDTPPSLEAGRGYFIKIDPEKAPDGTRFPVIYFKGGIENVAYEMPDTGWYLIGAPFGIDNGDENTDLDDQGRFAVADPDDAWAGGVNWDWEMLDTDMDLVPDTNVFIEVDDYGLNQAWMPTFAALNSIDPTGVSGGAATIVSPLVPGQIDGGWALPWDYAKSEPLFAGQAYWAFMREPGTLAGYESAPLYFDPPLPPR